MAAVMIAQQRTDRRRRLGRTMQERVKRYYDLNLVDDAYATIYRHHMEAPARKVA